MTLEALHHAPSRQADDADEAILLTTRGEFGENWTVLLASMIGVAFGLSSIGATYTLGIFVTPLTAEFGWTRGQIMTVVLVLTAGIIPSGLAAGWLSDRYGVVRLIALSQFCLGCCFIALGMFARSLTSFYAIYFVMALLGSGTLPITFSKIVSLRFEENRGLALGLTLCGTGVAAAVVPLYATTILGMFGWQGAYVALGLLPIFVALPLTAWLLRDDGPPRSDKSGMFKPLVGSTLSDAMRSYRFWTLGGAFFLISGVATAVLTSLIPLLMEHGFQPKSAAGLVGFFGVVVVGGRLMAGFLFDRLWAPMVGLCFLIPAAIGLVVLAQPHLPTLAVVAAVGTVALATGMELDLSAFLTARYFGQRSFGRIYGGVFVLLLLGGGIAAQLSGYLYDFYGSYTVTLYGGAVCVVLCAALLLTLGRYPSQQASPCEGEGEGPSAPTARLLQGTVDI